MSNEEVSERLVALEHEHLALEGRVSNVEKMQDALNKLINEMAAMSTAQGYMAKDLQTIGEQMNTMSEHITNLELRPSKRVQDIVNIVIAALGSAAATFIITKLFS